MLMMQSGPSRGIAAAPSAAAAAATKLLTISGSDDSTHVKWDLTATYAGASRFNGGYFGSGVDNTYSLNYDHFATIGIGSTSSKLLITGGGDTENKLGEFNIPTLSTSMSLSSLPVASNSHNFIDIFDAAPNNPGLWGTTGARPLGICVYNGRVLVNYYAAYNSEGDANRATLVVNDASSISTTSERGFFDVTGTQLSGGWISPIPDEYKTLLGGTHIFGSSSGNSRSILSNLSVGPSAYVFNGDATDSVVGSAPIANGGTISLTPLMTFPYDNPVQPIATMDNAGSIWSNVSEIYYGFIPPRTRTYVAIGFSAGKESGVSYWDPTAPWGGYKGYGPNTASDIYNYYMLFDVNDLIAAKNGTIQPHSIRPYETGELAVPFDNRSSGITEFHYICGGAYDPSNGRLYLMLSYADDSQGAESDLPLLLCYEMSSVV
jgi:hypothetical protein